MSVASQSRYNSDNRPANIGPRLTTNVTAPPVLEADAAEPAAVPVEDALPEAEVVEAEAEASELEAEPETTVLDIAVVADEVLGVILGPGPAVIMPSLPPGYVPPACAVKSCGTPVWLLPK